MATRMRICERDLCLSLRQVSEAMGGAVEAAKLHEFPWELHLSELRFHLQSNVVPIGMIHKGIYCHRALLFKVTPVHSPQHPHFLSNYRLILLFVWQSY